MAITSEKITDRNHSYPLGNATEAAIVRGKFYNALKTDFDAHIPSPGVSNFDTINEYTSGSGCTIDGVLLKDGYATFTAPNIYSLATSITAKAGGGQGSATQLTEEYSVITTVATAGDSVKLPAASAGLSVVVINLGANALDCFPATDDAIDDLGANTAISIAAEDVVTFTAYNGTNWQTDAEVAFSSTIACANLDVTPITNTDAIDIDLEHNSFVSASAIDINVGDYTGGDLISLEFTQTSTLGATDCNILRINDGANLTLNNASQDFKGIYLDLDGATNTSSNSAYGLYTAVPATFTGSAYFTNSAQTIVLNQPETALIAASATTNANNPNRMGSFTKNGTLTTAATGNLTLSNNLFALNSTMTNGDDGGNNLLSTGDILDINYSYDNLATTVATTDQLIGSIIDIDATITTSAVAESVLDQVNIKLIDVAYTVAKDGVASTLNQDPTSLIYLDVNVGDGVAFTSAGQFNCMFIDGDGFIPGASATANTQVAGLRLDFTSATLGGDISFTEFSGVVVDMPVNYATNGAGIGGSGYTSAFRGTGYGMSCAILTDYTPGTYGGGIIIEGNTVSASNPYYGISITKSTVNGTAVGALAVTNNGLYIEQNSGSNTAASGALTVANDIIHFNSSNSSNVAVLDLYQGNVLKLSFSAETADTGTAQSSANGLFIDYNLTETAGTLTDAGGNCINIDYDTTGTVAIASGAVRNIIKIDADDAGVVDYSAGASTLSGFRLDMSGINVASANLTLYGLNVIMPTTYSAATEYGAYFSGNTNIATILQSGYGLNLTMTEAASVGINIVSDETLLSNSKQLFAGSRDLSGAVAVDRTVTSFAMDLTQSVHNQTAGNFDISNSGGLLSLYSTHTVTPTGGTKVDADTFSGTTLFIGNTATTAAVADAILTSSPMALDINYTVTVGAASTHNLTNTNIERITCSIPTGTTSTGGFYINMLSLEGSTSVLNDVNMTFLGLNVDFSSVTNTSTAALYGIKSVVASTADGAIYASDGTHIITLSNGTSHISSSTTLITDMPVTSPGAGFDGADGVKYIPYGKRGASGMFVTEWYFDLANAGVAAVATDHDVIGEVAGAPNAYIGQILAANNGTVQAMEIICLEAPVGGSADIDIYSATESTWVYDNDITTSGTEVALVDAGGDWTLGMVKAANLLPSANQYLYFANGAGAGAGAYTAGKFLIRIYGI